MRLDETHLLETGLLGLTWSTGRSFKLSTSYIVLELEEVEETAKEGRRKVSFSFVRQFRELAPFPSSFSATPSTTNLPSLRTPRKGSSPS